MYVSHSVSRDVLRVVVGSGSDLGVAYVRSSAVPPCVMYAGLSSVVI